MKRQSVIAILVSATLLQAAEEASQKPVFRDAATHDDLVLKLRVNSQDDPMKVLGKSEGKDPYKENQPQNLLESSDLISFQGLTTLVPKRAIIKLPEEFKNRINNPPSGNRVVGWLDFYALNRGWITVVEITRKQAGGREDFAEGVSDQLDKSKNMIVAVFDSGPISYLPYKAEEEKKAKDQKKGELK